MSSLWLHRDAGNSESTNNFGILSNVIIYESNNCGVCYYKSKNGTFIWFPVEVDRGQYTHNKARLDGQANFSPLCSSLFFYCLFHLFTLALKLHGELS